MPSFPVLATAVAQRNLSLEIPNGDNTLEKEDCHQDTGSKQPG